MNQEPRDQETAREWGRRVAAQAPPWSDEKFNRLARTIAANARDEKETSK